VPFTLSHPAAALILARTGLPMVGVVAGSLVPDVPMFAPVPYSYAEAHSVRGVLTVDVVAGIAATFVWTGLVRRLVIDASPAAVRERVAVAVGLSRKQWLLLPVAVGTGAATHVLWDEFTHRHRWGYTHIAWLAADHRGHPGYQWAQAGSSVLGLVTVAAVGTIVLARRRRRPHPARRPALARGCALAAAGTAALVAVTAGATELQRGLHPAAITAAERGVAALGLGAVLAGLVWQLASIRTSPTGR
jgi:hypothetical protein